MPAAFIQIPQTTEQTLQLSYKPNVHHLNERKEDRIRAREREREKKKVETE